MTDPFKDTRDPLVRSMERASREQDRNEIERLRLLVKRGRYLLCELNEVAGDYSGDWEVLADAVEKFKKQTAEFNVRPGRCAAEVHWQAQATHVIQKVRTVGNPHYLPIIDDELVELFEGTSLLEKVDGRWHWTVDAVDFACVLNRQHAPEPGVRHGD